MRPLRLTARSVADFRSHGVTASPLARVGAVEGAAVDVLTFEAGAVLGRHPTRLWQLFAVVHGAGWASGADGMRVPIAASDCVLWEPGEEHESGSEEGMMVVVVVQTPSPPLPDIV
jgi:quercetin dioxygenase-like cupin family protein